MQSRDPTSNPMILQYISMVKIEFKRDFNSGRKIARKVSTGQKIFNATFFLQIIV